MSKYIILNFTVVNNFYSWPSAELPEYSAIITLTNTGHDVIEPSAWIMYGYLFMLGERQYYPYPDGVRLRGCGMKMYHVNGNFYRFQPIANIFTEIQAKTSIRCHIRVGNHQIARTDSMPNWFFSGEHLQPRIIQNTAGESLDFVSTFEQPKQYQCRSYKNSKPYTVQDRFKLYQRHDLEPSELNILPTPLSLKSDHAVRIQYHPARYLIVENSFFDNEIQYLTGKAPVVSLLPFALIYCCSYIYTYPKNAQTCVCKVLFDVIVVCFG